MRRNYQWLIEKLSDIFGKEHIVWQEFNYGYEFGIAYIDGNKRAAAKVEYIKKSTPVEWADVEQEDGSVKNEPVRWKHETFSLNEHPDKEMIVRDLIARWKSL